MIQMPVEKVFQCPFCASVNTVRVNQDDYDDWKGGEFVQNAFPYLSADERELFITGICPDCWPSEE